MRRMTLFLCVLCLLPILAYAEDYVTLAGLREQVGAGWHETFTAMGREVVVQADIDWFPAGDVCPVLAVTGAVLEQPGPEFSRTGKVRTSDTYIGWFFMQEDPFLDRSESQTYCPVSYTVYDGDIPTLIPEELDIGYGELLAQIDNDIAPYSEVRLADFRIKAVEVEGIEYALSGDFQDGTPVLGEPRRWTGMYCLEAVQLLRGIPLVETRKTQSSATLGGSLVYLYYSQGWRYYHLHCAKEVSVLQTDAPLLSFDAMKQIWIEQIEAGKLRGIDELEFGYLVCKHGKQFIALPVWRVKGGYTKDPNRKNVMPYQNPRDKDGSLTVPSAYTDYYYNAQTGEMMPAPKDGVRILKAIEIMTWEDVR